MSDEPSDEDGMGSLDFAAPILVATDLANSVAYYTEALGFETAFEWADSEDEPVRYAILRSGNTEVHLTEGESPRPSNTYFFVNGVSAFYERASAAGAKIICDINDLPWDMREFEVVDPDDNRLIFGEHLSRINQ